MTALPPAASRKGQPRGWLFFLPGCSPPQNVQLPFHGRSAFGDVGGGPVGVDVGRVGGAVEEAALVHGVDELLGRVERGRRARDALS